MKKYDNIDYSLFLKIICIVAILALVFAAAVLVIGVFFSADTLNTETSETHKVLPDETDKPDEIKPSDTSVTPNPTDTAAPDTQAPDTKPEDDPPASPSATVLGETEDMGDDYLKKVVFVADATNVGLRSYGMLDGGKNTKSVWRSSTGTLTLSDICDKKIIYPQNGTEITIAEAAKNAKPEYLVITLGLEGITKLDENGFKEQYTALINAVKEASPDTKIILQSIYPVSSKFTENDKLNNSVIDEANNWVLVIAESTGVKYLDTCTALKDADGALKKEYDNGGTGWSMNETGFEAVLNYIRTHGYK